MNVSSYICGTSLYHRMDVRPKLFLTLLFSVCSFLADSPAGLAAVFLFPLLAMVFSLGLRETWHCFSRLLPLIIMLVLFIPLQARNGVPAISAGSFVVATEEGIHIVVKIVSRLTGISMMLMLLLMTERNETIIAGLRAFRMPYHASVTASMILRFIPYLGQLFAEIRDAMSLRLEEGRRGYPVLPSIIALAVAAIRMIPDTASSLEERGFGRAEGTAYEALPRPEWYFLQWGISAIIPLILFMLR